MGEVGAGFGPDQGPTSAGRGENHLPPTGSPDFRDFAMLRAYKHHLLEGIGLSRSSNCY